MSGSLRQKLAKDCQKNLLHRWHGPYRIVQQLSSVNFKLRNSANRLVSTPVHVNRMKLYFDAKDRPIEPPAVLNENDDFSLTENELPVDSFAPEVPRVEETLNLGNTMPPILLRLMKHVKRTTKTTM